MPSYLIVGASRGIGLAFAEVLLKDPQNVVIATARNPSGSSGLQALKAEYPEDRFKILTLDVTDEASVRRAADETSAFLPNGLDCLIHSAGACLQNGSAEEADLTLFDEELRTNTIGPLRVGRAFIPLIRRGSGKRVAWISSNGGSLELAPFGRGLVDTYAASKAGLNMLARRWGTALNTEGITMALVHPGWVDTEMGHAIDEWIAKNAPGAQKMAPQESATACLKVIMQVKPEDGVKYNVYDGSQLPW